MNHQPMSEPHQADTPAPASAIVVVCADDVVLGTVEADEGSHLRLRRSSPPSPAWVAKSLIAYATPDSIRLLVGRDDLHDSVLALPPARQREYGTLEAVSLLARKAREAQG